MRVYLDNNATTPVHPDVLDALREALLQEMHLDAYFLEYDDDRSGDFRPLRYLPKDKVVVLGLVTTKVGQLENKEVLKRRIGEARLVEQRPAQVGLGEVCPVELSRCEPNIAHHGFGQVSARKVGAAGFGLEQHRALELGVAQVRLEQVGLVEIGLGEIGIREIGAAQNGAMKGGAGKIGPGKVRAGKIAPLELSPDKIAARTILGIAGKECSGILRPGRPA